MPQTLKICILVAVLRFSPTGDSSPQPSCQVNYSRAFKSVLEAKDATVQLPYLCHGRKLECNVAKLAHSQKCIMECLFKVFRSTLIVVKTKCIFGYHITRVCTPHVLDGNYGIISLVIFELCTYSTESFMDSFLTMSVY